MRRGAKVVRPLGKGLGWSEAEEEGKKRQEPNGI